MADARVHRRGIIRDMYQMVLWKRCMGWCWEGLGREGKMHGEDRGGAPT